MTHSWGNYPLAQQQERALAWRDDPLPENRPLIPFGMGRSYGDVALNDGGTIVTTSQLNHFMAFDTERGIVRCESGVTIADILRLGVPHYWFVPVSPGTKFVSVGGAIANDVHGKNHHRAGTFGCHIRQFELLRSDGRFVCSPENNSELFKATIGGLGLTGVITWAEIQLTKIPSIHLGTETMKTKNLDDFLRTSAASDLSHEFTVAWLDTATSKNRGLFMRSNWAENRLENESFAVRQPVATLPVFMPNWFVSTPLSKLFNFAYYHKQVPNRTSRITHYNPFFYPLDVLQYWNRLYGKRGFQSFQCIVPNDKGQGKETIGRLLHKIHAAGLVSPLTVLKIFGDVQSPGMLSFPRPGINLLLDFPNVGKKLFDVLHELDEITLQAGGRINPSKDAHMSAEAFQQMYPNWRKFEDYIDPAFSSSFWRRVTKKPWKIL